MPADVGRFREADPAADDCGVFCLEHSCVRARHILQRMVTILIVVLVLMLLGVFPAWGHSRNWGYGPTGGLTIVIVILLILVLTGRL